MTHTAGQPPWPDTYWLMCCHDFIWDPSGSKDSWIINQVSEELQGKNEVQAGVHQRAEADTNRVTELILFRPNERARTQEATRQRISQSSRPRSGDSSRLPALCWGVNEKLCFQYCRVTLTLLTRIQTCSDNGAVVYTALVRVRLNNVFLRSLWRLVTAIFNQTSTQHWDEVNGTGTQTNAYLDIEIILPCKGKAKLCIFSVSFLTHFLLLWAYLSQRQRRFVSKAQVGRQRGRRH